MNILLNFYFLIILAMGYNSLKKIRNSSDFFVADKSAGTFQITGSLLATILGSSAILGSISMAFSSGWAGAWFMICGALGLLLLFPLVDRFKNFKGYNLPELLGSFYGKEVQILSSIIIPIAWIGIVAAQIMGAAQIIGLFSEFSYETAVIVSGIVFIVYTIMGGQHSIIKTDFFQFILIIIGILTAYTYTSVSAVPYQVKALINEKFSYLDLLVMVLTYSSTFLVGPDIYSRLFCAKDEKVVKKSILISIGILIPLAFVLASIGIYSAYLYPDLQVASNSPLLHFAKHFMPNYISIILYFGLLSAVISSADTSLLTSASIFTQIFTKNLKGKNAISITRIFIALFGLFSILVALKLKFILSSLLLALSVYSGALIIPTLAGLFGYRAEKKFVLSAIILGGVIAAYGKLYGGSSANFILILAFIINGAILLLGKKFSKSKN